MNITDKSFYFTKDVHVAFYYIHRHITTYVHTCITKALQFYFCAIKPVKCICSYVCMYVYYGHKFLAQKVVCFSSVNYTCVKDFAQIHISVMEHSYLYIDIHPQLATKLLYALVCLVICMHVCIQTQKFYLKLRKQRQGIDCTPITTRQLESLIRLTEVRSLSVQ